MRRLNLNAWPLQLQLQLRRRPRSTACLDSKLNGQNVNCEGDDEHSPFPIWNCLLTTPANVHLSKS